MTTKNVIATPIHFNDSTFPFIDRESYYLKMAKFKILILTDYINFRQFIDINTCRSCQGGLV